MLGGLCKLLAKSGVKEKLQHTRKEIRVFIYSLTLSALHKQGSSALFSSLYMHVT